MEDGVFRAGLNQHGYGRAHTHTHTHARPDEKAAVIGLGMPMACVGSPFQDGPVELPEQSRGSMKRELPEHSRGTTQWEYQEEEQSQLHKLIQTLELHHVCLDVENLWHVGTSSKTSGDLSQHFGNRFCPRAATCL